MDEFIEIVGRGEVVETLVQQRLSLTLTVRAPQAEDVVERAARLRDHCIQVLLRAGLQQGELSEGGGQIGQVSWWWRARGEREKQREASHRILIASEDAGRVRDALAALEPLFEKKAHSLDVVMMSPRFEATAAAKKTAQRDAILDARAKANALASASGATLGRVLQIEELHALRSGSGAYGDEAYGNALSKFQATHEPEELNAAARNETWSYRVRFAIRTFRRDSRTSET